MSAVASRFDGGTLEVGGATVPARGNQGLRHRVQRQRELRESEEFALLYS